MKTNRLLLSIIFTLFMCIICVGCGGKNSSSNNSSSASSSSSAQSPSNSTEIIDVEGGRIENGTIIILLDDQDSVALKDKIVCAPNSTWKLCVDISGAMEISTKVATGLNGTLAVGDNIFYIIVTAENGTDVKVYQLNLHKSYDVTVNYYDGTQLLKTETVKSGAILSAFEPTKTGYTLQGWIKDEVAFTAGCLFENADLYADFTANTYRVTYDIPEDAQMDEEYTDIVYGEDYKAPVPTRTGYTFVGWAISKHGYPDTDSAGNSLRPWIYTKENVLFAQWEPLQFKLRVNGSGEKGKVSGGRTVNYNSTATIKATPFLGYNFVGWYDEAGNFVTNQKEYEVTIKGDASFEARFEIRPEMLPFSFVATETTCILTRVENYLTVSQIQIPAYVTSFESGTFKWTYKLIEVFNASKIVSNDIMDEVRVWQKNAHIYTSKDGKWRSETGETYSTINEASKLKVLDNEYILYEEKIGNLWVCTIVNYIGTATEIELPGGCDRINSFAFAFNDTLVSVDTGVGVKEIGENAFDQCTKLKNVTINYPVRHIGDYAFKSCSGFLKIKMNRYVETIGKNIGGNTIDAVYFEGNATQWSQIQIGEENTYCLNAETLYFYAAENPYENGTAVDGHNYWHYDENDAIMVWAK